MKNFRALFALLISCFGETGGSLYAADAEAPPCLVAFRLIIDADAKLQDMQKIRVIDLLSGAKGEFSAELPPEYLAKVRKQSEALDYKEDVKEGNTDSMITSFFHVPGAAGKEVPRISFAALDGEMNRTIDVHLLGTHGQMSGFGKNLDNAAYVLMYYALPELPKDTQAQREAIIDAEIERNAANARNVEILSKKNLSTEGQTIVEVTLRSLRNKALTIRSRYVCNERQMISLAATTTEGMAAEDMQAFERMFEAFRYR